MYRAREPRACQRRALRAAYAEGHVGSGSMMVGGCWGTERWEMRWIFVRSKDVCWIIAAVDGGPGEAILVGELGECDCQSEVVDGLSIYELLVSE